jgi:hypothetical protein
VGPVAGGGAGDAVLGEGGADESGVADRDEAEEVDPLPTGECEVERFTAGCRGESA